MGAALIVLYLVAVLVNLDGAFRRGADDSSWEMHWSLLDVAGQAWVATTARSRAASDEVGPKDVSLVAGYRRRQRRRRAAVDLMVAPFLVVGADLALSGLLSTGVFALSLAVLTVISGLWNYLRERQMDGRLRLAVKAEEAAVS